MLIYSTDESYTDLAVQGLGCVAEMAASHKKSQNMSLLTQYDFQTDHG